MSNELEFNDILSNVSQSLYETWGVGNGPNNYQEIHPGANNSHIIVLRFDENDKIVGELGLETVVDANTWLNNKVEEMRRLDELYFNSSTLVEAEMPLTEPAAYADDTNLSKRYTSCGKFCNYKRHCAAGVCYQCNSYYGLTAGYSHRKRCKF